MSAPDDDDLIAAEYALGTLDRDERAAAATRIVHDDAFRRLIEDWERRLSPLSEAAGEAAPPATVWPGILRRIEEVGRPAAPAGGTEIVDLSRAVRRWKGATAVMTALAACLAVALVIGGAFVDRRVAAPTLVAFLQKSGDAPAYLMEADLRDHRLAVKPVAAAAPAGRSYELWVIDPAIGAPKSLGLLDGGASAHPLPPSVPADVLARATYAVTEEAAGGSPSGAPSGQPVFVGHLVSRTF